MSERSNKICELAEDYYELYGRLFENRELLTEKQYDFLTAWFYESLKAEKEELTLAQDIPHRQTMFENRVKHSVLVPRNRFIFFKNRAKKLTLKELGALLNETFQAREEAYNALYGGPEEIDYPSATAVEQPTDAAKHPETEQTETETPDKDFSSSPPEGQKVGEQTKGGRKA